MQESRHSRNVRRLIIKPQASALVPKHSSVDGEIQVWRDLNGDAFAYGYTVDEINYLDFPGLTVYSFSDHGETVIAFSESNTRSEVIEDLYWRSALRLVLQMQGQGVLHASAILTPRGVVGICAQAQSGKSTIVYGLSLRDYPIWTDDALVFDALEEPVNCISLPFKVRLRTDPVEHYQKMEFSKENPSYWNRAYEQAPVAVAPLRAIIVLKRHDEVSSTVSLNRIRGAGALLEIMAHGYAFSLRKSVQKYSFTHQYLNLVSQVPVLELRFPEGLHNLSDTLDELDRFLQ